MAGLGKGSPVGTRWFGCGGMANPLGKGGGDRERMARAGRWQQLDRGLGSAHWDGTRVTATVSMSEHR